MRSEGDPDPYMRGSHDHTAGGSVCCISGSLSMVSDARVYERTGDASIIYTGEKKELIQQILKFDPEDPELNRLVPENSGRELNQKYQTKLVGRTALRITAKFFSRHRSGPPLC